ncbi:MAG TPA: hypothetical protein VLH79_07440 [Chthonomonadales bacterium]|nr:hypothetical protein [Chthonomonadales bacterium]
MAAEWVLVGLVGLLALEMLFIAIAVAVVGARVGRSLAEVREGLSEFQREAVITLQQVHDATARVETLAQTLDKTVTEQIRPLATSARATVDQAQAVTTALAGSVGALRRVAGAVESVATPAAAVPAVAKLAGSGAGRLTLAATIAGIALQTLILPAFRGKTKRGR